MTTLREAAQQAFVDMACMRDMVAHPDNLQFIENAMAALRTALAESPDSTNPVVESEQRTEPEQEPVAWRVQNATPPGGYVVFQQYPQAVADLGGATEPLYTHPAPQPVTLTNEEIENIALNLADAEIGRALKGEETNFSVEFARAVIEAYQRKQEGKV
jgi:hypothetical protein